MQAWIFYALLSAMFAALVAIFGKLGIARIDTTLATAIRVIIMAIAMVAAAFVLGKYRLLSSLDGRALTFIGLSGLAGAASWFWYFRALATGPTTAVVALDRLSVVMTLLLAAIFLGERITLTSGAGALLVAAGAFLLTR